MFHCGPFCETMVTSYLLGIDLGQEFAASYTEMRCVLFAGDRNKAYWPKNAMQNNRVEHNMAAIFLTMYTTQKPLYACYRDLGDAGHLVVVTGVDLEKGIVYTNNPWGIAGSQPFDDFLQGFLNAGSGWRLTSITKLDE